MRRTKAAISAFLMILLPASVLTGQQFQLRTRVDLVVVPFTVKGSDGEFITGLTREDFTVYEDGEIQEIQQFSIDPVPLTVAVVIDTGVEAKWLTSIQESIPAIAASFGQLDEIVVYNYNDRVRKVGDFTNDPEVLRQALDTLLEIRPTQSAVGGQVAQPSPTVGGRPVINSAKTTIRSDNRVLHDAVYEAAIELRDRAPELRKVILLVSDGSTRNSEHDFADNLDRLIESEIQVYTINLAGFFDRLFSVLGSYSSWTGGEQYKTGSRDALERAYAHITEQARNQYVLGYVSSNKAPPGNIMFREIEVRCTTPCKIVHKQGYYQVP